MAPSIAYTYFNTSEDSPYATCKLCSKPIKCRIRGSSCDPSNLLIHLRIKHPEKLQDNPRIVAAPPPSLSASQERDLNDFFDKQPLENIWTSPYSSLPIKNQNVFKVLRSLDPLKI